VSELKAGAEIVLTFEEILQGAMVGVIRQTANLKKGRSPAYGAETDKDWQNHVEGALGEMAFAKMAGLFWSGAHVFRGDDVGEWQVRTRSEHRHELMVHPEDPDTKKFILMTGRNGRYIFRGWITARDAKRKEWWKDPSGKNRSAFFVPQAALNKSMDREPTIFDEVSA